MSEQLDYVAYRRAIEAWERQVREAYSELGMEGEKRGELAFMEAVARGELSRGLREMAHGEFGPKAYARPRQGEPAG
jgi:hypothetical protein